MIDAFHAEVDALAGKLEREHRARLQCQRGCAACCVDDISVFEVEAARIVRDHALLLSEGEPHAVGACAFLDEEGACRIYAARPYVCRTQGLPLRWMDDDAEYRDICTLNEDGPLVTDLKPASCWTLGPAEAKLQAMQAAHGEPMKRVSLRTLFAHRQKTSTMR